MPTIPHLSPQLTRTRPHQKHTRALTDSNAKEARWGKSQSQRQPTLPLPFSPISIALSCQYFHFYMTRFLCRGSRKDLDSTFQFSRGPETMLVWMYIFSCWHATRVEPICLRTLIPDPNLAMIPSSPQNLTLKILPPSIYPPTNIHFPFQD